MFKKFDDYLYYNIDDANNFYSYEYMAKGLHIYSSTARASLTVISHFNNRVQWPTNKAGNRTKKKTYSGISTLSYILEDFWSDKTDRHNYDVVRHEIVNPIEIVFLVGLRVMIMRLILPWPEKSNQ